MSRWVRVQTEIFDHAVFAADPFSEREAWIWLISKAAWKDTRHRVGKAILDVPAGSVFLTLREMQTVWRWKSDKRVRSFLTMLEREEMIETKTDAGKTQVTICNYSHYQDTGRTKDASGTQAGRTADALKTPVHQYTNSSSLRSEEGVSTPAHSQTGWAFAEFCNEIAGSAIPAPRKLTPDRKRKIEARLKEHGPEVWVLACRKLAQSAFCNGSNDRGWIADLDFLCQPKSFNRLIEGGYDSRASPSKESKTDTAGRKFIERGFNHDTQHETNDLRNVFSLPAIRRD